jgi:two-component system, OmpR family, sensor histidine kinase QseC
MKKARPLQTQLTLSVLLGVSAIWVVMLLVIWQDSQRQIDKLLDDHLVQSAALLVAQQGPHLFDEDPADSHVVHPKVVSVMYQVFHDGALTLKSDNAPPQPLLATGKRFEVGFDDVVMEDAVWRVYASFGQETDVHVYVAERESSRMAILHAVLRSAFWPLLVALPLLGLSIWWTIHRGLRPLRKLSAALSERGTRDFHKFSLNNASEEITAVVDALNALFARIETLVDSERRFTADAAHELRTPIAAIRTQAQVALGATDETSRARALMGTIAGCERANRVLTQLLVLARLENAVRADAKQVDLAEICRATAAEIAPQAFDKQQEMELECDPNCHVLGDETLLALMLHNLIVNAVRYSPPRAQVRITVRHKARNVVVSVDDSGPGLSATEMQRVGERFFRGQHQLESGSGLGLSIARRIATVHEGHLKVAASSELSGLHVCATLKAA